MSEIQNLQERLRVLELEQRKMKMLRSFRNKFKSLFPEEHMGRVLPSMNAVINVCSSSDLTFYMEETLRQLIPDGNVQKVAEETIDTVKCLVNSEKYEISGLLLTSCAPQWHKPVFMFLLRPEIQCVGNGSFLHLVLTVDISCHTEMPVYSVREFVYDRGQEGYVLEQYSKHC